MVTARVLHGNPYRWRGTDRLLDINAAILRDRTPEQQAATEGHVSYFSWEHHSIRLRRPRPGQVRSP